MNLLKVSLFLVMASVAPFSHAGEGANAEAGATNAQQGGAEGSTVAQQREKDMMARLLLLSRSPCTPIRIFLRKDNFADPWPKEARAPDDYEITVVKEEPGEYIYETPHFRFISDAAIGRAGIESISEIFEATYEANRLLPLNNLPGREEGHKFPARFIEKRENYIKETDLKWSAGVCKYPTSKHPLGLIIIRFDFMGLRKVGGSYTAARLPNSYTVRHELTHQLTPACIRIYHTWYAEGAADYVALAPYADGRYDFTAAKSAIVDFVTTYDWKAIRGRGLGMKIAAPGLKHYMTMSQEQFCQRNVRNLNYALAPLVVYYFYHADGEGDAARIKEFVKSVQNGEATEDSLGKLLDGRTWDELAAEISAYWKQSGVTITFNPSSTEVPKLYLD